MTYSNQDYAVVVNSLKGKLPSLPVILNELMTIVSDHDATLHAIRDLLRMDPAISTLILKAANTTEFRQGSAERISSIEDALTRLGLDEVKKLALNISMLELYGSVSFPDGFSLKSLWKHSVGVAVASSKLAEKLTFTLQDLAYTCGLIHDIGKVAKFNFDQILFCNELQSAQENGTSSYAVEVSGHAIRHDLLGGMVARTWGISKFVAQVASWHHQADLSKREGVDDADTHKLIDVVMLANLVVPRFKFGNSGHNQVEDPPSNLLRRLGMSQDDLLDFEEEVEQELIKESEKLSLLEE
jgi:putative nucleotidyltransferase with HDIG domain